MGVCCDTESQYKQKQAQGTASYDELEDDKWFFVDKKQLKTDRNKKNRKKYQ